MALEALAEYDHVVTIHDLLWRQVPALLHTVVITMRLSLRSTILKMNWVYVDGWILDGAVRRIFPCVP